MNGTIQANPEKLMAFQDILRIIRQKVSAAMQVNEDKIAMQTKRIDSILEKLRLELSLAQTGLETWRNTYLSELNSENGVSAFTAEQLRLAQIRFDRLSSKLERCVACQTQLMNSANRYRKTSSELSGELSEKIIYGTDILDQMVKVLMKSRSIQ